MEGSNDTLFHQNMGSASLIDDGVSERNPQILTPPSFKLHLDLFDGIV